MRATDTAEIGRTGLRVTRLGLGGVALSGAPPSTDPHQPAPEDEALALIGKSLALGLNYLDTAPMYGVGESERRYGQALRGVPRDRYVLSTKVGRVLDAAEPGSNRLAWSFDFSGAGARRSFQSSMERLGLERVDILFIHDPDDHYEQALAEAFPVLVELQNTGRVRAIGAGINQWQMELAFARQGHCDCFLLAGRYTLLDQTALLELLPYCVERGIAVVAGGPYNSGILAVGARAGATFNYRAAAPEMMDKAARIGEVCAHHGVPLKAAALQFILAHPAIVSVIPGARSIEEVEDNARMVEHPIPAALWADLKDRGLIVATAPNAPAVAATPGLGVCRVNTLAKRHGSAGTRSVGGVGGHIGAPHVLLEQEALADRGRDQLFAELAGHHAHRPPARAVPRRHHAEAEALQVGDGVGNDLLGCAGEVEAAHRPQQRRARCDLARVGEDVHDAGVRARREDELSSALDQHRDEALVHDPRIGLPRLPVGAASDVAG